MNSRLHAVTDALGRPLQMFLTAGQRSDYIGARALLEGLPPAKHMLADRGYDAAVSYTHLTLPTNREV